MHSINQLCKLAAHSPPRTHKDTHTQCKAANLLLKKVAAKRQNRSGGTRTEPKVTRGRQNKIEGSSLRKVDIVTDASVLGSYMLSTLLSWVHRYLGSEGAC